ncbi:acyl-CoA dehydrogenase family protein [Leekyejoonella antrihumi]|uniref:Acyl-CoA dehydrogenase n=1 Tax=Leekyejoonella antrihumi TaxID=1660198 RepID=A0A563DXJ4_9MICO|nr:acyl-CoA dehydrogenase family protein [Leekyejoonella antrihumi]TWP34936.1 acyl-CoA dehydrogenase [Leekyejoonella antrihumi]
MKRPLMTPDHETFRTSFDRFLDAKVLPRWDEFERDGIVDRSVWKEAGSAGFLALEVPEEFGGAESTDFCFNAVLGEQINARVMRGFGLTLHNDIVVPYLMRLGTREQQRRWLPGMVTGDIIAAIAMTEPGAGSDLSGISTRARRTTTGYVVNGQKTFITNGQNADIIVTAVRTDDDPYGGLSLLVIERGMPGFDRGRNLDKLGMHAQDTSELFFDNVEVPAENLLGQENKAFGHLVDNLPRERLSIAVGAVAAAERAIALTIEYVRDRAAFRKHLSDLQNTRFVLADLATQTRMARVFVDDCITRHNAGELGVDEAAMVKLACTENQVHVVDRCLQLHGGFGYMAETQIGQLWRDSRPQTIYGGASEVMKHIIGKSLVSTTPAEGKS